MRPKRLLLLLLLAGAFMTAGCWDRLEVEDQIWPVTMAVDKGEQATYRLTVRVPISAELRAGILGGRAGGGETAEIMVVEADNIMQGMRILNAAMARRLTLRHLRGIAIGEELARAGIRDLLAEMLRNGEIHETIGVWVSRGSAGEMLSLSRPTGEFNPGKINEGLLLVQKGLHMAPPIRLHHLINRKGAIGVDPIAALIAVNPRLIGEGDAGTSGGSALAGHLARWSKNPVEVAGTAVFQDHRLAGFLTVDETQALLALRGEMGKAYITLPDPLHPGRGLMIRFQQENLPQVQGILTPEGPRVQVRLLFEGEVLTGDANFMDASQRIKLEQAAKGYMEQQLRSILTKFQEWEVDPVGFGLQFRSHFFRWRDWQEFEWRTQISQMEVDVTAEMRLRRFGMLHGDPFDGPVKGD